MIRRLLLGMTAVSALTVASIAAAHDFFLMPERFTTDRAGAAAIDATVGSSFPTPEIVVPADRVERLFAAGPGNPTIQVVGAGEKALNLEATGAQAGLFVAGGSSKPREVDYAEDRIPLMLMMLAGSSDRGQLALTSAWSRAGTSRVSWTGRGGSPSRVTARSESSSTKLPTRS